jgi:DNA mismatch repair protein MutL
VSRQAVLAEHPLPLEEMETLIGRLQKCRMPYTSPYGRPTLIEMSQRELERKFGR